MDTEVLDIDSAVDVLEDMLDDNLDTITPDSEPVEDEEKEKEGDEPAEDPEDEPEEPDEDEEESEEEEEDEPSNPAVDDETLVDITIDGEEYEVNFAELKSGYLRNEEYVSRVQKFEAEYTEKVTAVEQKEAELVKELQAIQVAMLGDLQKFDNVNWEALKAQDPAKYQEIRLAAVEARERAGQIQARQEGIKKMHEAAQEMRHKAYVQGQVAIAEKLIPGFREPEKFNALVKYATDIGYSKEDVLGIADARHLLLLHNAMLYAQGVARKKEATESKVVTKKLPPVLKPGATRPQSSVDRQVVKKASARLHSEKSVDAAAAYLMTLDL